MSQENVIALSPSPPEKRDRLPVGGVLLIGNFLSATGGKRSVCEDLAEQLGSEGWRIACASDRTQAAAKLAHILRTIWTRRRDYRVAQVDVFSGKAFVWAAASCLLLRMLSRPYVLTLHGGNLPDFARRWPRTVGWLLSTATAVTVPSNYLRREFLRFRPDLRLLPNGLALQGYPFRLRSGIEPRLIWVRSFHEMYNPRMAVDVVARLRVLHPSIHLTMVGPDRGDGSLDATRCYIEALNLSKCIRIVPGVSKSELPALLAQADVFINTTNVDNAPVTVLEAMACGLCVVSTDAGGIPDFLTDRHDALLVRRRDAEAMAESIKSLLANERLCARLSSAAHETARKADWGVVLPQWLNLLASAQGQNAR